MVSREKVIHEYFQLRVYLNKANKFSNEKTSLHFELRSAHGNRLEFIAKIGKATANSHVVLAEWTYKIGWQTTGYSPFSNLEEYILTELKAPQNSFKKPSTQSVRHIEEDLIKKLRSLGLEKL